MNTIFRNICKFSNICCYALYPLTPYYERKLINKELGIDSSDCKDCFMTCCCATCSLIQNENNWRLIEKLR